MKNWETLEPDRVKLLSKHFTSGRGGAKIDKIVVHHNGGNLSIDGIWSVWQTRKASAHYQVTDTGQIGQLVWDRDTAWHAADSQANRTSIGIEHANSSGPTSPVTDATLENGAHLVAAICKKYNLGRPQWGKNVYPHKNFTSTDCPGHLAGDQNTEYMARAQYWYDQMTGTAPKPKAAPTPKPAPKPVARLAVDGLIGPKTVTAWQSFLNQHGGRLTIDGKAGRNTWQATQRFFHTPVDGIISSQYRTAAQVSPLGAITQGWDYDGPGAKGSTAIRALQKWVGAKVDGIVGPDTIKAWQGRLNREKW